MTDSYYKKALEYPRIKMEKKIKEMYDNLKNINDLDRLRIEQYKAKLARLQNEKPLKRLSLEEKINRLEEIIIKRGEKNRLLVELERDKFRILERYYDIQRNYKIYDESD